MTEWPEFRELDWAEVKDRMTKPLIVDGRNFLDRELLERPGLHLRGRGPGPDAFARERRRPSA